MIWSHLLPHQMVDIVQGCTTCWGDETETKTKEPCSLQIQEWLQLSRIPRYDDRNLQERDRMHHLLRGSWPVSVSSRTHIRCSKPQLTKDVQTPIPRRSVIEKVQARGCHLPHLHSAPYRDPARRGWQVAPCQLPAMSDQAQQRPSLPADLAGGFGKVINHSPDYLSASASHGVTGSWILRGAKQSKLIPVTAGVFRPPVPVAKFIARRPIL